MAGKPLLGRPLSIHFSHEQVRPLPIKPAPLQQLSTPDDDKKHISLSNEAMDAKIFAIKTKLQLMEKEGSGSVVPETNMPITKRRYEPYHRHKHS